MKPTNVVIFTRVDGPQLPALLDALQTDGETRVVFPGHEYRTESHGDQDPVARNSIYDTARLQPRGDDGGFAARFLKRMNRSRHTRDT